jgi:hypothetical protein
MLGLGATGPQAMLWAKAASYHGWPIFFGQLFAMEGVCIVRRMLRRISMKHQKKI